MSDSSFELSVEFTGDATGIQAAAAAANAAMDSVIAKWSLMSKMAQAMATSVQASMASVVASTVAAQTALDAFGQTQVTATIGLDAAPFLTSLEAARAAAEAGVTIPIRYEGSAVGAAAAGVAAQGVASSAGPSVAGSAISAAAGSQMAAAVNGGQYDAMLAAMRGATPANAAGPAVARYAAGAVRPPSAAPNTAYDALLASGITSGAGLAALRSAQIADAAAAAGGSSGGGGGGLLGFLGGMAAGAGGGRAPGLATLFTGNSARLGVLGGLVGLGAAIPGAHGLLGLMGFGPEHALTTAIGIGGSAVGAGLGGLAAGAGVVGPLGVGFGSDMAVMSSTIADTKTLATAFTAVQTAQQNATQAQQLMNAAIAQFGPNSAQATAAITAYQSAVGTTTTAQVSMDQTIATLSGTTPALQQALTNVQLAQLNLNAAVSQYGANSVQATTATAQLTAAQNAFNTALTQTAPGVAAEIRLGQAIAALNVQWDQASQGARVAAVAIAMALLPIAAEYIPAIADAAQKNFTIVGQYLQPIVDLINGPGMTAFNDLEGIFASHIPMAMQIAAQALQLFITFMQFVANVVDATGGKVLAFFLKLFTYLNTTPGTEKWETAVQHLINTFYAWWDLIKQLTITVYDLFDKAPVSVQRSCRASLRCWHRSISG